MKTLLCFVLTFVFAISANARCFPEPMKTDSYHPMSANTGISQKEFNEAVDLIQTAYADESKAKGYNLVINKLWSDDTINSDTDIEGGDWVVNAYGGLARYSNGDDISMTKDAFINVLCHEMGHHLGGAPMYSDAMSAWAATEGEADYWSSLICMKNIDPQNAKEGAQVLSSVLASLELKPIPSEATWDKTIVKKTFEDHPAAQCRFDTYMQGLACGIDHGDMSEKDPKVNSCYDYPTAKSYSAGSRPRCWFAP